MDFTLNNEQQAIIQAAKEFALGEFVERALEFDREERFDLDIWRKACDLGLIGVFIDAKYGGQGYGFFEHCLISEEFWAVDPGIGQSVLSTTFGSEIIQLYGTEEQKVSILPRLVSGEAIVATAITEPDAGSDVTGVRTSAVQEGGQWVINGSKMFITNGSLAQYIIVFALTNPDEVSRHHRHSFFIVPSDVPGFSCNKIRGKLGIRASDTAELAFSAVKIPFNHLIGKQGEGFRQLMAFFNRTRLHVCAQGVGVARAALEESIRYAKQRQQFGGKLASFQGTQFKLAEMATRIKAARGLYYEAAWLADQGKIDHGLIAMAKWYAGETAVRCADEALQIHGGYGYFDEFRVQRLYRDAKIVEIYEGTKEVEKGIVAGTLFSP
ncbi:acyl-CoA dehydrogenase family protein [Thermodesulfobacteriota bacterium]